MQGRYIIRRCILYFPAYADICWQSLGISSKSACQYAFRQGSLVGLMIFWRTRCADIFQSSRHALHKACPSSVMFQLDTLQDLMKLRAQGVPKESLQLSPEDPKRTILNWSVNAGQNLSAATSNSRGLFRDPRSLKTDRWNALRLRWTSTAQIREEHSPQKI